MPGKRSKRLLKYLPAAITVVFCVGVIGVALPVFWNSLIAQRSIETVNALKRGESVSTERLMATLEAIGPIDADHPAIGDRLINQGILSLAIALRLPTSDPEHLRYLMQAKTLTEQRLRRAPADTHSWVRLALAEYLTNGPSALTFDALRMSYQTGPYEYHALRTRLELGVLLWALLDEDLKQETALQMALLWRIREGQRNLVAIYLDMPQDFQERAEAAILSHPSGENFTAQVERARLEQNSQ